MQEIFETTGLPGHALSLQCAHLLNVLHSSNLLYIVFVLSSSLADSYPVIDKLKKESWKSVGCRDCKGKDECRLHSKVGMV